MPHFAPSHPNFGRRTMLQAGSIGLLGLGMSHVSALRAAEVVSEAPTRTAKSVIFIFLSGGLSQIDSFDPKPDAAPEIRGEFQSIATQASAIRICEHLPMLAARSQMWSLVRTLSTPYNGHSDGHMAILSMRTPLPLAFNGSKPQSTDWPALASVVGDALPSRNTNLPPAIVLPNGSFTIPGGRCPVSSAD